jgi:hypothetical protein
MKLLEETRTAGTSQKQTVVGGGQIAKMLHPKVQHLTRRINDEL